MFNKTMKWKKANANNKKTTTKKNVTKKKPPIQPKNINDKQQAQAQTVNVYTHANNQRRTNTQKQHAIPTRAIVDTYQPRLPLYHPFVNAPVHPPPLQNPVNVYVNGALTNNTPDPGELVKETSQNHPSPPDTSLNQPSTPKTSKKLIVLTPKPTNKHSPFKNPAAKLHISKRAKRGKTFDVTFPEGTGELPKLSDRIDVLDEHTVPQLRKMAKKQGLDIQKMYKLKKDELISEIKQKH